MREHPRREGRGKEQAGTTDRVGRGSEPKRRIQLDAPWHNQRSAAAAPRHWREMQTERSRGVRCLQLFDRLIIISNAIALMLVVLDAPRTIVLSAFQVGKHSPGAFVPIKSMPRTPSQTPNLGQVLSLICHFRDSGSDLI